MAVLVPASLALLPITVQHLSRYAVKGLSGDKLDHVEIQSAGECFPGDRNYALLKSGRDFDGQWLHKENFLCAFTAPELLAGYESEYSIQLADEHISRGYPADALVAGRDKERRRLRLSDRSSGEELLEVNLQTETGRKQLAAFLSHASGETVSCVTKEKHQFGNTSSGVKHRSDTRTIHIVNQATVDDLSLRIGGPPLSPRRFRPNLVIDGAPAWSEFDWVGQAALIEPKSGLTMTIISKTVRCRGVSVDPEGDERVLDIPSLLVEHFPEHGPYLGVYAVIDAPGQLSVGDKLELRLN